MSLQEKVTLDKTHFDALLRRANLGFPTDREGQAPTVLITAQEYQTLLLALRQFQNLKCALVQGGVAEEALELLVSGEEGPPSPQDSAKGILMPAAKTLPQAAQKPLTYPSFTTRRPTESSKVQGGSKMSAAAPSFSTNVASVLPRPRRLSRPLWRDDSSDLISFDEQEDNELERYDREPEEQPEEQYKRRDKPEKGYECSVVPSHANAASDDQPEKNTLILSGFSPRTSLSDVISLIKGGNIFKVYLRAGGSAIVIMVDGAADFLHWTRRQGLYIHGRRIEVRWADKQYSVYGHMRNQAANGATRNLVIYSATDKGLDEQRIRDDMEHIHTLVIIDVAFRGGNAYVSTNSIQGALYARSCMQSRLQYRGCKIGCFPDGCDVELPTFQQPPQQLCRPASTTRKVSVNRYDVLDVDPQSDDD